MIQYTIYYKLFSKHKFQEDAAWCASNAYVAVDAKAMHASSCIGKTAVKIFKKKKIFWWQFYRRFQTKQIDTKHSEFKHFLHIL